MTEETKIEEGKTEEGKVEDLKTEEPKAEDPKTEDAPVEPEFEPEMDMGGPETDEEKAILDAVNEQLDGLVKEPKDKSDDDSKETKEPKEAKPGEEKAGEEGEGGEEKEKPKEESPEELAARLAEKKEEKPEGEVKPSNEFGELPEDTKTETKERFSTLKTKYDEIHAELDTAKEEMQSHVQRSEAWAETIQSTGTNPEQFGLSMQYLSDVNSGTQEGLERAYETMQKELGVLGRALGKEVPGFDPLDAHQDLKTELDDGGISRERALEIAAARSTENLNAATAQTTAVTEENAVAARESALQGLTDVGNMIRDFDPHYEAKKDQLIAITQQIVQAEVNPGKWPALIAAEYKKIPNPAPVEKLRKAPMPITAGSSSAGSVMAKKPGSAEEAVELALAQMRSPNHGKVDVT